MSEKRSWKRQKQKAFKIVSETFLTSKAPKHVFNNNSLRTISEKFIVLCVKAKKPTKPNENMCMWRQLDEKNFELTHQSADDERKPWKPKKFCNIDIEDVTIQTNHD